MSGSSIKPYAHETFRAIAKTTAWDQGTSFKVVVAVQGNPYFTAFSGTPFYNDRIDKAVFLVCEERVFALFQRKPLGTEPVLKTLHMVEVKEEINPYSVSTLVPRDHEWFDLPYTRRDYELYALWPEHGKPVFFESKEQLYLYLAFKRSPELFLSKLDNSEFLKLLVAQEVELFHAGL